MANTKISQWTEQTLSNMAAAGTSDLLGGINTTSGSQNRKFSLATIANFILSKFKPSALSGIGDGSTTGAISSLNSKAFPTKSTINCNTAYANAASGLSFLFANNSSDNTPIASSQIILNFKDSDSYGTQLSITNSSTHKVYMRTIAAGTWSSWDAITFS